MSEYPTAPPRVAKQLDGAMRCVPLGAKPPSPKCDELGLVKPNERLEAVRITQRARDVFRDVRGLVQNRFRRARTLVEESHALHAERTVIVSKRETTIDGERILIG